jgi:hypothetical protein
VIEIAMDENRTADTESRIINVEAPYFENLKVGQHSVRWRPAAW